VIRSKTSNLKKNKGGKKCGNNNNCSHVLGKVK